MLLKKKLLCFQPSMLLNVLGYISVPNSILFGGSRQNSFLPKFVVTFVSVGFVKPDSVLLCHFAHYVGVGTGLG